MASRRLRGRGDDLVNIGTRTPKSEKLHQIVLNRCQQHLMHDLDVRTVMIYIQQNELFDDVTIRDIMEQTTISAIISYLIDMIKQRDKVTYERFKECLVLAKQVHLKKILEEEEEKIAEEMKEKQEGLVIPAEILRMDEGSLKLYRHALKDGIEKDYSIRVMVVGHYGVGKTTLVQRLLGKDVNILERTSTDGIDIHIHCFDVSLTSQKWTVQEKDAQKTYRLQRIMKLINEKVQMVNISDEEDGRMERTAEAYASNVPYDDDIKKVENLKQKDFVPSWSEENDPAMEILKLLVENGGKLERVKDAKAGLSFWDFAGQFVFYTTHQIFLTTRAVYLLVIDLSQQMTDDVKDDECFFDREGRKVCKVHDFIEVWLNSIHTCSPSPESGIPAVILVGTHADKIPQDSRQKVCESVFTQIRCQLKDKPTRFHLADEDFVIDNSVFDPKLEELKRKIVKLASKQPFWGEGVPARWLHLEQLLMKLKDTGVKVIPYSLVESLNKKGSIQIETKEEMDLFLRFLHETGTILYFNTQRLREKIVLNPQWLIHALKSLITAETFVSKDMAVLNKWYEFKDNGKLTLELIDAVWTKQKNPQLHDNKEHILLLMEQLNIVARPRSFSHNGDEVKVESYLIAPCMLRQMTPKEVITPEPNPQMESTSVLCYVFKEKFLPPAIFHRLFASCMACWSIAKKGKETLLFCGGCVFDLDHSHRLYLHFRDYVIFARITRMGIKERTPNGKFCLKVRESITEKLDEIIKGVGQRLDYEIGVQCPRCDGDSFDRIVPVSVLQGRPEVLCHCHVTSHVIISDDLLKLWFEDSEKDKIDGPSSCFALKILDEVPSEKHLNRLSMKIGKEYVQLGVELDIPMYILQQIQEDYPRIATQCFKILQEWVQRNKDQATFRNLEKAFSRVRINVSEEDEIDDPSSDIPTNILDVVPSEKQLNRLSMKISKEYVQLGLELEVPMCRIEQIQMEYPRSIATQCFKILKEWVQRGKKGQATFRNLEKAFRRVRIDVSILKDISEMD